MGCCSGSVSASMTSGLGLVVFAPLVEEMSWSRDLLLEDTSQVMFGNTQAAVFLTAQLITGDRWMQAIDCVPSGWFATLAITIVIAGVGLTSSISTAVLGVAIDMEP